MLAIASSPSKSGTPSRGIPERWSSKCWAAKIRTLTRIHAKMFLLVSLAQATKPAVVVLCTIPEGIGRQLLRSTLNHIRSARRGRRPAVLLGLGFGGTYCHSVLHAGRSRDHFYNFLLGFLFVTSSFGQAFCHDLYPLEHCLKSAADRP